MKLTIGFSPCPNDTFIFDALVNHQMDAGDLEFEVVLEDVETLNRWALEGKLDITKLSFPAFFQTADRYVLLRSGSALGEGVGPLLISNKEQGMLKEEVRKSRVAIPGEHTTAHLLFNFAYPEALNKKFMVFSEVEDSVLRGEADLGVLIHETRFTYQQKGLHKVADLGAFWEEKMQVPVPLGGIAIRRTLDPGIRFRMEKLIRESIEYAFARYPELPPYVRRHSQTMQEEVMRQHIELYVNEYSADLGEAGKQAIETLFGIYRKNNGILSPAFPANGLFN